MILLSHRGLWLTKAEQNTLKALKNSFQKGFGCELDIRDHLGQLVISHDVSTEPSLLLEEVLQDYKKLNFDQPIAINIKADGLQSRLKELIDKYSISNYFVFDMSVADTLGYEQQQIRFFTRQSEYEPQPPLYEKAGGVWLDCFESDWWTIEDVKPHIKNGKAVALVSPELHKRDYLNAWENWRKIERELATDMLMLCTDFPEKAKEFFHG